MLFVCYPKCSTGKKAQKWLIDHQITFESRHIKEECPTADELKTWIAKSGLPVKKFLTPAV